MFRESPRRYAPAAALVGALLLLFSCAHAAIVPPFEPHREQVVLAKKTKPRSVRKVGAWTVRDGRIKARGAGHWVPTDSFFGDGTARVRIDRPMSLDLTILLRARLDKTTGLIEEGYGVTITGRAMVFTKYTNGEREPVGHLARWQKGRRPAQIEAVISAFGEHLVVTTYDTSDGTRLSSLALSEIPTKAGLLGIVAHKPWGSKAAVSHISTREACHKVPKSGAGGAKIVAMLPPKDRAAARKWGDPLDDLKDPPRIALLTDPVGLEHLYCDGPTLIGVATQLPARYNDPDYNRYREQPPVRTKTGFKLNLSYKNPEMIEALLKGYHQRYPESTLLQRIGSSRRGRPIWALAIASNINQASLRPAVLLNGGHHGSEALAPEFVLDAIQQLLEKPDRRAQRWLQNYVIWAVPLVNPDGSAAYFEISRSLGRKNGHDVNGDGRWDWRDGVDLNRNYPFRWGSLGERGSQSNPRSSYYRGTKAASEPETRAMMRLARREHFVSAISYHTGTVAILAPYTIDDVNNPGPNEAWTIAEEIAAQLKPHPQGQRKFGVQRNLYPVDGVDQDWHRHAHGTVALLVEGAKWTPPGMPDRDKSVKVVRPTWQLLLDRHLDGPSISGHVRDREGYPVLAEVRIMEQRLVEGERWQTRCRDGRFDRILPGPGTYTVRVLPEGHAPMQRRVNVKDGNIYLDFELPERASKTSRCVYSKEAP